MDKRNILRYLRVSSITDDEKLLNLMDECCEEINSCISSKTLHRIFSCEVKHDRVIIGEGEYVFKSRRLAENLNGCKKVVLFGATLGTECDRLLRTYSKKNIAKAAMFQACLTAAIEEVCDDLEVKLEAQGLRLRKRYSPGYFDLDITENRKIFELLDLSKRIGLSLTDTCQMVPTKSVTAFIGIEDED